MPFSALTVWYIPGLDHVAHYAGMDNYKDYFKDKTDDYIKKFVAWLKTYGEFNNKIFIIVADHGHTAMPTTELNFKFPRKEYDDFGNDYIISDNVEAETSCNLKLDFGSEDRPDDFAIAKEKNNNNLHIWELGNLFSQVASLQGASIRVNYKVLVPNEIDAVFKDKDDIPDTGRPTTDKDNADVIAALNGPMAHIYIKGSNWSAQPEDNKVMELAEVFRLT